MKPKRRPKHARPADAGPERGPRRTLAAGAAAALAGIALVGIDSSDAGVVLCVVGVLAMIYGIHTFGRLGPEGAA